MCLFAKRLEQGRFVWPNVTTGGITLTGAQLAMLVEGVDWRRAVLIEEPQQPATICAKFCWVDTCCGSWLLAEIACAMSLDLDRLPDDPALLRTVLRDLAASLERQQAELEAARAGIEGRDDEIERLRLLIRQLQRHRFVRRSEQLGADQLQLALEELEAAVAEAAATQAAARPTNQDGPKRATRPSRNRGSLPTHLLRFDVFVDVDDKGRPCCGGAMHVITGGVSEMLDVVPAQLRVKVLRRLRYGCRACSDAVVQAPAPPRPIPGGLPTEAMLAHVLIAKCADFLPLCRQPRIVARQGIELHRSALPDWVGHAARRLAPLHERLLATVLGGSRLFADDTPLPVPDPGRGRTRTGRLWPTPPTTGPGRGPRRRPSPSSMPRTAGRRL